MPDNARMLAGLILATALAIAAPAEALEQARVVDGDTIRVRGEAVRVLGLDAPEMRGRCPAEIRLARRARNRMAELVRGGVRLEVRGRRVDRYRRLLRVVRDARGRDVAAVLIGEGLARPYDGGRRAGWCGPGIGRRL